jgi:hypothetical protein
MFQRSQIKEGMTVRSIDGEKLGKVFAVQEGEFLIEKGLFFPKDYVCRYSEINDIRDGEIILMHGKEGLHRFSLDEDRGVLAGTGGGAGVGPGAVGQDQMAVPVYKEETVVVPLRAEEVDVQKRAVVDEEAVIRKDEDVEGPRKLDLTPDDPSLRRS